MKHVDLDGVAEAVKQFVLALSSEPAGSILELNGRPLLQVLPVPSEGNGSTTDEAWTQEKNTRRCALIDREIAGTLTIGEVAELDRLQRQMLEHRRRITHP
jgi:hypothetical protein